MKTDKSSATGNLIFFLYLFLNNEMFESKKLFGQFFNCQKQSPFESRGFSSFEFRREFIVIYKHLCIEVELRRTER